MSRDELLFAALVLAFATLVTIHVSLCAALAARPPRLRALAALCVPPLAPLLGLQAGLWRRALSWILCALAYVALRLASAR